MGGVVTTKQQEDARVAVLKEKTPQLLEGSGELLYIGGGPGKLQLLGYLQQYHTTVLEIDAKNAAGLEGQYDTVVGRAVGFFTDALRNVLRE